MTLLRLLAERIVFLVLSGAMVACLGCNSDQYSVPLAKGYEYVNAGGSLSIVDGPNLSHPGIGCFVRRVFAVDEALLVEQQFERDCSWRRSTPEIFVEALSLPYRDGETLYWYMSSEDDNFAGPYRPAQLWAAMAEGEVRPDIMERENLIVRRSDGP